MGQEGAESTPAGGFGSRSPMGAPTGSPEPEDAGSERPEVPRAPLFTAGVDQLRGSIRVRGHLDRIGAQLLCDSLVALQRGGHQHLTVRLHPAATADAEARAVLTDLAARLATDGVHVDLR